MTRARSVPAVIPVVPPLLALAASLAGCAAPDAVLGGVTQAVTLTEVTNFGSNPGALKMFTFVPSGLPSGAPLVVVLHGCTESASSYSTETEWGNLAGRFGFA
ncbi:MAG: esterase, partial [Deltaproteobacteria bacterium]